jgi:hypothetical protein
MTHCILITLFIPYKLKNYIKLYVTPTINIQFALKEAQTKTKVETL